MADDVFPGPRLDGDGRIAEDVYCIECGYNLRTLGTDAVCPECASPVAAAVRGDFLKYCQPA